MRNTKGIKKETSKEIKIKSRMESSSNIKTKDFKKDELLNYEGMSDDDINVILEYQKKIPILSDENVKYVDGRELHSALEVKEKYTDWFKRMVDYGFVENIDYLLVSEKRATNNPKNPLTDITNHKLNLDMAKEIAMIQRTPIGKLTRQYFIAIEKAYKLRYEWNYDRADTIEMYCDLRRALRIYNDKLLTTIPQWASKRGSAGVFMAESNLLNTIIVGMSSSDYKYVKGLDKNAAIRNFFTEEELERVAELERYDADLILIQNMFDYKEREKLLNKKHAMMLKEVA